MIKIEEETQIETFEQSQIQDKPIKHAVILAAGKSQRFREKGMKMPKVLLKVGGLRLMERSILTLKEAGIEHFYIVLGAYREQIREVVGNIPRLKDLDVNFVECENYELGNGVSFAAGAAQVNEAFLLTMCDHIFAPETINQFIHKALEEPNLPALACDPNLEEVFDMDDATKVVSKDGFINRIGKELEEYDLVDTGLFYFPGGYGQDIAKKASEGAHSVSNIIQQFIDGEGVRSPALENAMWQDVDYPGMKKEAERRLMKYIETPNDGWIAKNLNRKISTPISLFLAQYGVKPNWVTTFVLLLSLLGAFFAGSGNYGLIVLGAFIFQIASILDGCDGEIARFTYQKSKFGAWYNRLTGNLRFGLFFGALGFSAYQNNNSDIYYYGLLIFVALAVFTILSSSVKSWNKPPEKVEASLGSKDGFFTFWRKINKQDVFAFMGLLFCIVFQYQIVFWLALIGTFLMAISSTTNGGGKNKGAPLNWKKISPILFYIIGFGIIGFLFYFADLSSVKQTIYEVGSAAFLVFATAILWMTFDTLSAYNLIGKKVSFPDMLYNQVTGNGYNILIPLAGLGGEPYKIKHLTQWVDVHTATQVMIRDRMVHATSGALFTVVLVFLTILFVPFKEVYKTPFLIASGSLFIVACLIIWATLSKAPTKLSGFLLKKLNFIKEIKEDPLPTSRYILSLFYKMMSRLLYMVEIYVIFRVLGFTPEIHELLLVTTMLMLSASIFFVMPQGIGVNEIGIAGALTMLGYAAPVALTFALLRRARNLFWGVLGVSIHLGSTLIVKLGLDKKLIGLNSGNSEKDPQININRAI